MPTYTRIITRAQQPTSAATEIAILRIADAEGKAGAEAIRTGVWAISRFKRPTGRSTKAWTYSLRRRSGAQEVTFSNDARNKYGTNYPRYVHLSGRPRSDLLMFEVEDYVQRVHAPRLAEAVAKEIVRFKAAQPLKTTTTKIGG